MTIKMTAAISTLALTLIAAPALAKPDLYVMNFHNSDDANSQRLSPELKAGLNMSGLNAEEVFIDTSTAAKWEKGAHEAFDRDLVPHFNRWVGLPGFAAVVDADSRQVLGCVDARFTADEIASEIRKMAAMKAATARMTPASTATKTTECPAAHNPMP